MDESALVEENRRLRQALEQQRQRYVRFARHVSHDLRAPVRQLLSMARVLNEAEGRAEREELLRYLEQSSLELQLRMEGLLKLTRALGDAAMTIESVELTSLVRACLAHYQVPPEVLVAASDTPLHHSTDARMVGIIVDALVANAQQWGGGVRQVTLERDGDALVLSVIDRGPGLSARERERAMVPLSTLGPSAPPRAGVGLSVAEELALHLGGEVWLEETPGGGLTARVRLGGPDALVQASATQPFPLCDQ